MCSTFGVAVQLLEASRGPRRIAARWVLKQAPTLDEYETHMTNQISDDIIIWGPLR